MDKALVIKTTAILHPETMKKYQKVFAEQLKTGVVLIPAYFSAELLNVPKDVKVIVESGWSNSFLDKEFNIKGE